MKIRFYLFVIFTLLFVPLAQAEIEPDDLLRHEQGRELYNYRCYYCHGYSGDAKTLAATMMEPPPRNFTAAFTNLKKDQSVEVQLRDRYIQVVSHGVDKTAMKSFTYYLNSEDIETVVDFVLNEFVLNQRENTRYHTAENGWPDHQRYNIAFPFATGEVALDKPQSEMSVEERSGYQLYLSSCISCHDWGQVQEKELTWRARSISFPRNNFSFSEFEPVDAFTSASVFASHDLPFEFEPSSESSLRGQLLFADNCAFCHGHDGTGKNWIGAFLDRAPRDLTDPNFINLVPPSVLSNMISNGLENTSMPAWKFVLNEAEINDISAFIYENATYAQSQKP